MVMTAAMEGDAQSEVINILFATNHSWLWQFKLFDSFLYNSESNKY